MFGRKGLPSFDADTVERLSLAYLTALDEIEALVGTIKEHLGDPAVKNREELTIWRTRLVQMHTKALTVAKSLPSGKIDRAACAREAQEMEAEVSRIAESLWGEDEARVSGFIMAEGILNSNA